MYNYQAHQSKYLIIILEMLTNNLRAYIRTMRVFVNMKMKIRILCLPLTQQFIEILATFASRIHRLISTQTCGENPDSCPIKSNNFQITFGKKKEKEFLKKTKSSCANPIQYPCRKDFGPLRSSLLKATCKSQKITQSEMVAINIVEKCDLIL